MKKSLLAVLAISALSACNLDSTDAVTTESLAAVYRSVNVAVIVEANGTYWSVGSLTPNSVSVGTGTYEVSDVGVIKAKGLEFFISQGRALGATWDYVLTTGTTGDNIVELNSLAFGTSVSRRYERLNQFVDVSGAVPSRTYDVDFVGASSVGAWQTTGKVRVAGQSVSANVDGCVATGTVVDTGYGYGKLTLTTANSSLCAFPNTTMTGVAVHDKKNNGVFFTLKDSATVPNVAVGVSVLSEQVETQRPPKPPVTSPLV